MIRNVRAIVGLLFAALLVAGLAGTAQAAPANLVAANQAAEAVVVAAIQPPTTDPALTIVTTYRVVNDEGGNPDVIEIGDVIQYQYSLRAGGSNLSSIQATDNIGTVNCPQAYIRSWGVMDCYQSIRITPQLVIGGEVSNQLTVSAIDESTGRSFTVVGSPATVKLDYIGSVTADVTTQGPVEPVQLGSTQEAAIIFANTSSVSTVIKINGAIQPHPGSPCTNTTTLGVVVPGGAGYCIIRVEVTGSSVQLPPVALCYSDVHCSAAVRPTVQFDLTSQTAQPRIEVNAGDEVVLGGVDVQISNQGDVPLQDVSASAEGHSCSVSGLRPGDAQMCLLLIDITDADRTIGSKTLTITASGRYGEVVVTDQVTITIPLSPVDPPTTGEPTVPGGKIPPACQFRHGRTDPPGGGRANNPHCAEWPSAGVSGRAATATPTP